AHMQTDTDREPLIHDAATGGLLHGDGAAHGVCRRREHTHQAVAKPFHLLTTVGGDATDKQAIVRVEDALRVLVGMALRQVRRVKRSPTSCATTSAVAAG